jgi:hypothetical protein
MIFSRNIVTAETAEYDNCEQAGNAVGLTPSALARTYIDKPRQLKGYSWRSDSSPIWVPPQGLAFATNVIECTKEGSYVKAVWSSDPPLGLEPITTFDSVSAAARILKINRRSLADAVAKNGSYGGAMWSHLPAEEYNNFELIPPHVTVFPFEVADPPKVKKQGGKIKVIVYDILKGEEIGYTSVSKAAAVTRLSSHAIEDTLMNKPRRAKNFTFRSGDAEQRWEPPTSLRYQPDVYEKNFSGYIIAMGSDGTLAMYEGPSAAGRIEELDRHAISAAIKSGKEYRDRVWRAALDEEFDTFVPIA